MMNESIGVSRISLGEFIATDCISNVNLQFHGEEETSDDPHSASLPEVCPCGESSSILSNRKKRHCLNATRVSLLLAKAFAKLEEENIIEPSLLQLENFVIHFQQLEVANPSVSSSEGHENLLNQQVAMNEQEVEQEVEQVAHEERRAQHDFDDDDDFDLLLSDVLDDIPDFENHDNNNNNIVVTNSHQGPLPEVSPSPNCLASHPPPNQNPYNRGPGSREVLLWKILDIEFLQPPSSSTGSCHNNQDRILHDAILRRKMPPLQILGNHLHALFSRANNNETNNNNQNQNHNRFEVSEFSFSFLNGRTPSPEVIEAGRQQQEQQQRRHRSSKLRMIRNGNCLFSTLVEGGEYPVSMCRLLADAIDSGISAASSDHGESSVSSGGCSSSSSYDSHPYSSLAEVIADLERMSNHPRVFLYDQPNEFYSTPLHFGQRCYGRVGELTKFLEVSTRLEQHQQQQQQTTAVKSPDSDTDNGSSSSISSSSPAAAVESRAEAVFVSGVAGSGKSNFVQNVSKFLRHNGSSHCPSWMVVKVKFQRKEEHDSREVVSSLFEKLVSDIVDMGESENEEDVDYYHLAIGTLSEELDPAHLACLSNFIPSISELMPAVDNDDDDEANKNAIHAETSEVSLWQLVFLLSKLMGSILSLGRKILVCCDDLQWCNSSMLTVLKELIVSVGESNDAEEGSVVVRKKKHNFLFVGMFRDDEVSESDSLMKQLAALRKSNCVNVTEIKLSSLSTEEVNDMIMSEMRLPMRLVKGLGGVVHKKTSGHAIFVSQVLNSLVRDSTIAYSPRKHRFDWDENKIATLRMGDSVASLIVSNLSSLETEALQSLRVLSCFGVQIPFTLIKLFRGSKCIPKGGIESYLPGLIEGGVVELSTTGPSVFFSHDLIQQHVYENVPIEERRRLHLDLGTYIASEISLDASLHAATKSAEAGVRDLNLGESSVVDVDVVDVVDDAHTGELSPTITTTPSSSSSSSSPSSPSYPLVAIATNQINFAGPDSVSNRSQQIRFAGWNLRAGKDAAERSNFQAALYFYETGAAFLGRKKRNDDDDIDGDNDGLWQDDSHWLCRMLHEGSAAAYFAVGDHSLAEKHAMAVIDNVPFEDSLVSQYIIIRVLDNLGRYSEAVTYGLDLLSRLKFDIPSEVTPSAVMKAMADTGRACSAYSFEQITSTHHIVDEKKRTIMNIANVLTISFFRHASPYLPLVGCAVVNYSLQNGVCEESSSAFMIFGYFKNSLEGKYDEGCYWGNVVLKILQQAKVQTKITLQTDVTVTMYLNFLYNPLKELAFRQLKLYQKCTAIGEMEIGLMALVFSLTLSFYGGEKLSLILKSAEELIRNIMNHSREGTKIALLNKLLIDELMGNSSGDFPDFGGVIRDESSLFFDAQTKQNFVLIEGIHIRHFNSAFWMGDYAEANKLSQAILALPSSKNLKVQTVFHTFFMGLIAFHMYRDGEGEDNLEKGEEALVKMEVWSNCSAANHINKLLLLEAEHHASMCNIKAAKVAFQGSVRAARDYGLVHEQGLACELYGKFLTSIIETDEALCWLKCAHACYMQWGAIAKAEQVWKVHNLDMSMPGGNVGSFAIKHGREW